MTVYVIKTVEGAEIVGRIDPDKISENQVTMMNPLEVRYKTDPDGYTSAVLSKYNYFGATNAVMFNKTSIITVYECAKEYEALYERSIISIEREVQKRRQELLEPQDPIVDLLTGRTPNTSIH